MTGQTELAFRPLYQHVREHLLARVAGGTWEPGQALPSEQQLAADYGVSQGTIRKALNSLAGDNVVVRRQGRGTFVAIPEEGRLLFQFYSLRRDDGTRTLPSSQVHSLHRMRASAEARERLDLTPRSFVWKVERSRTLEGRTITAETLTLSAAKFPDLDKLEELPNNVYMFYSTRFRQTITRAEERLKAATASERDCELLGCAPGQPLLLIDRIAYELEGAPVEWRLSRCLTEDFHYRAELR